MKTQIAIAVIREAVEGDWQAIKALVRLFPDKLMQTHLPSYRSFFVAEIEGVVRGCCALAVQVLEDPSPEDIGNPPKSAEVRSLAVNPNFRSQGLGSRLVDKCVERSCQRGILELVTYTGEKSLFERLGFRSNDGWKFVMFKQLKK